MGRLSVDIIYSILSFLDMHDIYFINKEYDIDISLWCKMSTIDDSWIPTIVMFNYFEVVKYFHSVHRLSELFIIEASKIGRLNIVKYYFENANCEKKCSYNDMCKRKNHVTLEQLYHEGLHANISNLAMGWAVNNNHYNIVEYLHTTHNIKCKQYLLSWAQEKYSWECANYIICNLDV